MCESKLQFSGERIPPMFRKVSRNPKQELSKDECIEILNKLTSGVLNVLGDDDYPYGVPLSYSLEGDKLYFHGRPKGHKMDSIIKHNKASFTVIETDQVVPEEYTTYFRSVIVFGKIGIVEDLDEKRKILDHLVVKYSKDFIEGSKEEINAKIKGVCIFTLNIDHMSGKEAIEFAT